MPDVQSNPYNYNNELQDTGVINLQAPQIQGDGQNTPPPQPDIFSLLDKSEQSAKADNPWMKSLKYNEPINTKLSDTERYADSTYGFNPLNPNLENQYGDRQSWFTEIGHDIVKTGANVLGAFAQTIATIPNAVNAAVSGDFSKMEDNPVNNTVSDMLQKLDTSMPDFKSTWEQAHPLLNYLPFIGHGWGKVMQNVGFVAGAIGASVLQDAAVGALTAGLGDAPLVGMQLASIGSKLGKIMSGAGDAFKGMNEAFLAGNKAEEALDSAYKIAKISDRFRYGLAIQTGAWSQAAMLANNTHRELRNQLQQDFFTTHGYDAKGDDAQKIEDYARHGANADMLGTAALLTVTDAIQFPSILKPFSAAKRAVESTLENKVKIGLEKGSLDTYEAVNPVKGIKGFINNILSPSRLIASSGVEAAKMGGQLFFQRTAEDFYKRKFDDANITDTDNLTKSISQGLNKVFFTSEGQEATLMGGLIGIAIHGLRSGVERLRGIDTNKNILTSTTLGLLNQDKLTGTLQNHYDEAATSVSIQKDMQESLKSGNLFEYKNLQHQQLFNLVNSGVKANRFDARIDQLRLLKELSPEQFKSMFQMDFNDGTRATAAEYVDAMIDRAYKIKKNIDKVQRVFINPYDPKSKDPREQEKSGAFENLKTQLSLNLSEVEDNRARIERLHSEISDIAPGIDSNKLVNLTSEEGVKQTIKDFTARIKEIEKDETLGVRDAKNTREKEFLQNKIESFNSDLIDFQPARYMRVLQDTMNYLSGKETFQNKPAEDVISPIDLPILHQKASDVYKLGVNSDRATKNYDLLTSKKGFEAYMDGYIKEITKSGDNLATNNDGQLVDKRNLPASRNPDVDVLDEQMNPIKQEDKTTSVTSPALSAPEAKELADLQEKSKTFTVDQNNTAQKPVLTPEEVTRLQELEGRDKTFKEGQLDGFLTGLTNKEGINGYEGAKEYVRDVLHLPENATLKDIKDAVEAKNVNLKPLQGAEQLSGAAADVSKIPGKKVKAGPAEKLEKIKKIFAFFNPQSIFNKLNSRTYADGKKYAANLEDILFNKSSDYINKNMSLKMYTHERDFKGYTAIEGFKDFYRQNNKFDADLVVDSKEVGKLSPSDTMFYKRGKEYIPISDITKEEYVKAAGNSPESFDEFQKQYNSYHEAYRKIASAFEQGKTEFSPKELGEVFDAVPIYGRANYVNNDSDATLIKNLKYRQPGDVILSLLSTYNAETGKYGRTDDPSILDEENVGENWMAIQHFLHDNIEQIQKLNSRYVMLRQSPDGQYRPSGILAARPAKISPEEAIKFQTLISSIPDSPTKEEIKKINTYLRDKIYIADSNNDKGSKTNMSLYVEQDGSVSFNIFNKDKKVSASIKLGKENLRNAKDIPNLVTTLNEYIRRETLNLSRLGILDLKLSKDDFKAYIEHDDTANMQSVEDKLTVPTPAMSYQNYSIRMLPKGVELNEDSADAKAKIMSTRGVRTFSKTRLIGLVKGVYNRLFTNDKLTDVQERRLNSMELPLDANEKLDYKELAKVLNVGESKKISDASAAKIADTIGKVKSNPEASAAKRPDNLTPEEHKAMDAVETSTLPLNIKEKVEASPKAAIQQLKKEAENPNVIIPAAIKESLKDVKEQTQEQRPPKEGDKLAFFSHPEDAKKKHAKKIEFSFRKPEVQVKDSAVTKDKYNVVVDGQIRKTGLTAKEAEDMSDGLNTEPSWYFKDSKDNWQILKGKDLQTAQDKWDELQGIKKQEPIIAEPVTPILTEAKSTEPSIIPESIASPHIEIAQAPLWMKPVEPKSPEFYSHLSEIQKAFKSGQYDEALKAGKITEQQIRDIFLSMKMPQYDEQGTRIEDTGKNVYGDMADQIIFRVSHPDLISDVDYWKSNIKKDAPDYDTYVSAMQEVVRNGSFLDSIKNGILSIADAKSIYHSLKDKLLSLSDNLIDKAGENIKIEDKIIKETEKKADEETEVIEKKLEEVDERPTAAPIVPQAEGISILQPKEKAPKLSIEDSKRIQELKANPEIPDVIKIMVDKDPKGTLEMLDQQNAGRTADGEKANVQGKTANVEAPKEPKKSIAQKTKDSAVKLVHDYENDDLTTTEAANKARKLLETNEQGIKDNIPSIYKKLTDLITKADNMRGKRSDKKLGIIEALPDAQDDVRIGSDVVYDGETYQVQDIIPGVESTYYDLGEDLIINSKDVTLPKKSNEIAETLSEGTDQEALDAIESINYERSTANGEDLSEETPEENDKMLTFTGLQTILGRLKNKFGIDYKIIDDENMKEKGRFVNGQVIINMHNFTKDTAFHEYMHPFIASIKVDNPELYNKLHELLAEDPYGEADLNTARRYYKDLSEEDQKDEALVSYLGKAMAEGYTKEGLRSKSKYWEALKSLINKFRKWMGNVLGRATDGMKVSDFSTIHTPMKSGNINITSSDFIENMTLADFSNYVAQSDIRFDLSNTMDIINNLDKAQKDVNDEQTEDGKIIARVQRKIKQLRDTGERRLNSPELLAEAETLSIKMSQAQEDEALSVNNYVHQGVAALKFANSEIKDVQRLLHLETFNQNDTIALNKRLKVARELTEFYNRDVNHLLGRIVGKIPEGKKAEKMKALQDYKEMSEILRTNNDKINQFHSVTADLLTEWLYPYIQISQNTLDPKYDAFKLSKQQFKNKLLIADADPKTINFWLSSIGSMRDPVNSIVKTAMIDIFKRNNEDSSKLNLETQDEYRKFLLRNNLKNDRKETSDWNEKNYLRKVSNWEKTGEDKDGKPEYGYVERKAFHEEFKQDQWDKDRRTFIDKLGDEPDAGDKEAYQSHWDRVFAWEDANSQKRKTGEKAEIMNRVKDENGNVVETASGIFRELEETVPSKDYKNDDWDRLKSDPFYQKIYKLYKEANSRVSDNKLEYGIIPQVSKGKNSWSDLKWSNGLKENAKLIGKNVADHFRGKDDVFNVHTEDGEVNFGNDDVNLDGSIYKSIKHPYTRLLDDSDVSTLLVENVLKYHHAATIYDNLKEAEPNIKALQDFVNGGGLGMKGREVRLTTSKGGVILDKIAGLPQLKAKQLSRLNQQLNGFVNDVVYDDAEFKDNLQLGSYTLSLNKIGSNLGLLTALNNMAFNIGGGIANVTIGNFQSLMEGFGGKYYTKADWAKANGEYWSSVKDIVGDVTNVKKSPTTQLAIQYDAIQGEFRDKYGKNIVGSIAQRYANLDSIFFVNHIGEHQIQTTFMLAMMRGQKVKLTGGGETNLREAYRPDKDGYMRLRPDAIWSEEDKTNFMGRLHSKNYELNGNYSAFDKAMIQRKWYGKMALIYRKYLYNAWRARYADSRMDYELRDVIRGNYNTFFSKLKQDIHDYKFEAVKRFFTREGWNDEEKYAYNKTVMELSSLAGVSMLAMAIAHAANKKDDSWPMKEMYLRLLNLQSDLTQYSVGALPDLIRIAQNPSVILGTLTKYADFFQQLGSPTEKYQQKAGIFKRGDSKLMAKFLKAFPGVRQVVNIMQPEEQAKFYQMSSGSK